MLLAARLGSLRLLSVLAFVTLELKVVLAKFGLGVIADRQPTIILSIKQRVIAKYETNLKGNSV